MTLDGRCNKLPVKLGADWVIRQVRVDTQGTYLILYSYSPDTSRSASEVHPNGYFLTKISKDGIALFTIDLAPYYNRSQIGYVMNEMITDDQNRIYVTGIDRDEETSNYIWIFNSKGIFEREIKIQDQKGEYLDITRSGSGEIIVVNYNKAKQRTFSRLLEHSWSLTDRVNNSITGVFPVFACASSKYDLVEYGRDGVYSCQLDSGNRIKLVEWKDTFVQSNHLSHIAVGNHDGTMVFDYYNYQKKNINLSL